MKKSELLKIIKKLLKPEADLYFLLNLEREQLETLVACIRDRVANINSND
jgi:hypothetical protein